MSATRALIIPRDWHRLIAISGTRSFSFLFFALLPSCRPASPLKINSESVDTLGQIDHASATRINDVTRTATAGKCSHSLHFFLRIRPVDTMVGSCSIWSPVRCSVSSCCSSYCLLFQSTVAGVEADSGCTMAHDSASGQRRTGRQRTTLQTPSRRIV